MAAPPKLIDELLKLPEDVRAELAEALLGSLEADAFVLTAEQEAELGASRAEAARGESIAADDVFRELAQMTAARVS